MTRKVMFDKLIRDKMPPLIEEVNYIHRVPEDELVSYAVKKLVEESEEVKIAALQYILGNYTRDRVIDELGDVLEVVDFLMQKLNIRNEEVLLAKEDKKKRLGGFDEGLILSFMEIWDGELEEENVDDYICNTDC